MSFVDWNGSRTINSLKMAFDFLIEIPSQKSDDLADPRRICEDVWP
jgi:hypothetical protein